MLDKVKTLFSRLNQKGIPYCQWKSNVSLDRFLNGEGDLDLLVPLAGADKDEFTELLAAAGFKRVYHSGTANGDAAHFYGVDEKTGTLVHLHVYYSLVTGESLLKNFRLPLAEMLLSSVEYRGPVKVPEKSAELAVFVIRMILKYGYLAEVILTQRDRRHILEELKWLTEGGDAKKAAAMMEKYLPEIKAGFFNDCFETLRKDGNIMRLIALSYQMRMHLGRCARYNPFAAAAIINTRFISMVFARITGRKTKKIFRQGRLVALVGSEASGKSTMAHELASWLGRDFSVRRVHAGKPPVSILTAVPNLLLPLLRKTVPEQRVNTDARKGDNEITKKTGLIRSCRLLMVAHDRWLLLKSVWRMRRRGLLIICDRYPSKMRGVMDSPRITGNATLERIETFFYDNMPVPDLIIRLSVPEDVAVARNRERRKTGKEDETYVRARYAEESKILFGRARVVNVDVSKSLGETLLDVKRAVWECV